MKQGWMDADEEDSRDILIVDDEEELATLVQFMLQKGTRHRITAMSDPRRALALFKESPADLVISDIEMPGMNGLELLESIKGLRPQTEVVMLTGRATFEAAVSAIRRQAFDFLEKPPTLERLLTTVHNALSRVRMREELENTLAEVAAAKSLMERFGRDRDRFQIPHERLVVAGLLLAKVQATGAVFKDELRASLSRIADAADSADESTPLALELAQMSTTLDRMDAAERELGAPLHQNRRAAVEIDVNAFVRGEVERFFSIYPSMQLSLEIPAAVHLLPVQTSGLALSLHNILENAVHATSRGGHVRVACAEVDGAMTITIDDDGPGFPQGYEAHFAGAFRGGADRGNAGMGLAIARAALEEQKGTLSMQPHPVGGARLEIRLPRSQ